MTRKDYIVIAAALRQDAAHIGIGSYISMSDWNKGAYDQWNTTVLAIATVFERDNARFDRARFLTACGVQL